MDNNGDNKQQDNIIAPSDISPRSVDASLQIITPQAQNQPIENNLQTAQTQANTSLNVQNVNSSQPESESSSSLSSKILTYILTMVIFFVSALLLQIPVLFIPGLSQSGAAGFSEPNAYGFILTIVLALTSAMFFYMSRD